MARHTFRVVEQLFDIPVHLRKTVFFDDFQQSALARAVGAKHGGKVSFPFVRSSNV